MRRVPCLPVLGLILILILGVGAGAWWYLFGPNKVDSAELVPTDTVFFATIPNAASIVAGYETSQLKQLVEAPNSKPISDALVNQIGQKNIDLFNAFMPNLSGQSFLAVTHYDPDHPEQIGLIAAMKPKAGMGDFDNFVAQLKTTYPDVLKQATTGMGNVAGVDYQWIKGPGAMDKICVAQLGGWIVTAWGEASLQDWIERFQKKSTTPSLLQNPDYQKSLARVGKDSMTLAYLNYHAVLGIIQKDMAKTNPGEGDYIAQKFGSIGGLAVGTRFENGEIVDRFSCLIPHQTQIDSGMAAVACPFDTLKFAGPYTRFYWASSINPQQYWKSMQAQAEQVPSPNPMAAYAVHALQAWAQSAGVDIQHNIIDPLGTEFSVQAEWSNDSTYPEVGFFMKVDKPDDFQPTINAIIQTTRKAYENSAVINELNAPNGPTLAALKFVQALPISPTITESGPYFGIFSNETIAVQSFSRDQTVNLPHVASFSQQIGDKRNGASLLVYVDTPNLLNHAYTTAMPYLSLVSMFNKELAAFLKNAALPNDLTWLAPMGTWSFVLTPDDEGINGYSVSGIGNQGILMAFTAGGAITVGQSMGIVPLPKTSGMGPMSTPPAPVPAPAPNASASNITNSADATPPAPTTNSVPMPDTPTNPPPATIPETTPSTNSDPNATPPAADTNH